ncbi:hypothetical protein D7Y23_29795 [Corallococcus sp. AB050B]|nr:hypothetical protein D7Y23_29795 [Corallococcus sp. AB050B]
MEQTMDTEALQVPLEVFLATHHPVRMTRQDLQTGVARQDYSEKAFLEDFFQPSSFAFVPILGDAGTGKSHLVRWLHANISSNEQRRVLLIPKVGTNLRSVIDRILGNLRGERFDALRKRLREETDSLTEGRAREVLLNNLATESGPNGAHGNMGLTEGEEYCVQVLPHLLHDPFFRKFFLADGGIIDRLATHVLGRFDKVERLTERRQFAESDLSFNLADVSRASADARDVYFQLNEPTVLKEAVRWLNRNLDAAIASLLHLRGEGLLELMTEVREELASQGVELVLLIEDFAKLQGIEHQLLEALLVRSAQEGRRPICGIRTALACTSGYFKNFHETVRQRATFTVNLDVDTQVTSDMEGKGEIVRFVCRYLNAARLPANTLNAWYRDTLEGRADSVRPPNACEGCPHLDGCHRAFGESDGVGLYPFNANALHRMMERVSPGRFVPRLLLKDVLKHTLEMYTGDLQAGRFPSPALRAHFSGGKAGLPIALTDKLHRRDKTNADRRAVLLEFWSKGKEFVDLDPIIHEAFALPSLGVEKEDSVPVPMPRPSALGPRSGQPEEKAPVGAQAQVEPRVDPKDADLAEQLAQLNAWMNGGPLPATLANTLRPYLHTAIVGHSRWDPALLLMGYFAGEKEPFQPRSINFRRQSVQYSPTSLLLEIPARDMPEDFRAAAFALEGLLRVHRHGHWGFSGGARYLRTFTSQLERWTRELLARIQAPTTSGTLFDPVPAAVELLALGARMAGRPAYTKASSTEEVVDVLFLDWFAAGEPRGQKWRELSKVLANNRQKLQQIVVSRTGCTKGGARSAQILDGVRIVQPLRWLLKDWHPREALPEDLKGELDVLVKVRQKVDELLDKALTEEQERHLAWAARVTEVVAPEADWKELVAELRSAMTKARDAGVFAGGSPGDLEESLRHVEVMSPSASSVLSAIGRLREQDSGKRIVELSRDHHTAMSVINAFLERAQRFLDGSVARVNSELSSLRAAGGQELEEARDAITASLEAMVTLTEELKRFEG